MGIIFVRRNGLNLRKNNLKGFTLAELLIALAILGIIAVFTIPKVLTNTRDQTQNSMAKEAVSMISQAYQNYRLNNNNAVTGIGIPELTQYMNYVAIDTVSTIDRTYNAATVTCSNTYPCLRLHNGAKLLYSTAEPFDGTGPLHSIYFYFDPDGVSNPSTTGPGKSVLFFLYAKGRVTTYEEIETNTIAGGGTYNPTAGTTPPWFSW